jgi:DNA-binding response OmpR family regulator
MVNMVATCLIVDDEAGIGWALSRLLSRAGFGVEVAGTAAAAVERVKSRRYSTIFLDVKLPDGDGFELARDLGRLTRETPIVMLSAYFYAADLKVRQAVSEKLVCGFVPKPFRHHEILSLLQQLAISPSP